MRYTANANASANASTHGIITHEKDLMTVYH